MLVPRGLHSFNAGFFCLETGRHANELRAKPMPLLNPIGGPMLRSMLDAFVCMSMIICISSDEMSFARARADGVCT